MNKASADHKSPGADPVVSQTTLEQYAKRKTSLLERLVAAYLDEAPLFHSRIRRGMESGDLDAVKSNAHGLKSCSHNMGAIRQAKLCQDIETSAGCGDQLRLTILLEKLGPGFFEVEEELRSALYRYTGKCIAVAARPAEPATVD